MLQTLMVEKKTRKMIEASILNAVKKKNISLEKGLDKAFTRAFNEFKSKHKNLKIETIFDLEVALKKNKKLRKDFYSIFGKHVSKELGIDISKISEEKIGKIAFTKIKRFEKAKTLVSLKSDVFEKLSVEHMQKLQALFDETAKAFGMDIFRFYHKYNTDAGFRKMVNAYVIKRIKADKDLAILSNEKPETIIHSMATLRAASLTRRDVLKFVGKNAVKRLPIELAKVGASMGIMVTHNMAMMPLIGIMSQIPGLNTSVWMVYSGSQTLSHAFTNTYTALSRVGGAAPTALMKYGEVEHMRRALESAGEAGLVF